MEWHALLERPATIFATDPSGGAQLSPQPAARSLAGAKERCAVLEHPVTLVAVATATLVAPGVSLVFAPVPDKDG